MSEADLTTFNLQYDTWCADRLTEPTNVKPFEYFCADQILKDRSLSHAELMTGQVDKGDDGGVDAFYCFFNGVLLDDDTPIDSRSGGLVEVKIIQSKQGSGFSPTALDKISRFLDDLLSFNRQESDFAYQYHDELMRLVRNFKSKFDELRKRSTPKLKIEVYCVTRKDINEPANNAIRAARKLEERAAEYYSETEVEPVQFIGAKRLWALFRVAPPKNKSIAFLSENFPQVIGR